MHCVIDGVSLLGPGLADWVGAQAVLTGETAFSAPEHWAALWPNLAASMLPPTERRRAGNAVRLAVMLAEQTLAATDFDPAAPALVFASSSGDTQVLTDICASLATPDRMISPMRFHNSVHNAPSGYWAIHSGGRMPATAIALADDTVAGGLREAVAQVVAEQVPVLLVVHDIPFPAPIHAVEPIAAPFGFGLLLSPHPSEKSLARLTVARLPTESPTRLADPALDALCQGVPAARGLPLLVSLAQLMAQGRYQRVVLADGAASLVATLAPVPCA